MCAATVNVAGTVPISMSTSKLYDSIFTRYRWIELSSLQTVTTMNGCYNNKSAFIIYVTLFLQDTDDNYTCKVYEIVRTKKDCYNNKNAFMWLYLYNIQMDNYICIYISLQESYNNKNAFMWHQHSATFLFFYI